MNTYIFVPYVNLLSEEWWSVQNVKKMKKKQFLDEWMMRLHEKLL